MFECYFLLFWKRKIKIKYRWGKSICNVYNKGLKFLFYMEFIIKYVKILKGKNVGKDNYKVFFRLFNRSFLNVVYRFCIVLCVRDRMNKFLLMLCYIVKNVLIRIILFCKNM